MILWWLQKISKKGGLEGAIRDIYMFHSHAKLWFLSFVSIFANILIGCVSVPSTQYFSLDEAITESSITIQNDIDNETRIAVLNINSPSNELSQYIIDELIISLVKNRNVTVVDRQESEVFVLERNFQLSGEVSDETAQSIGKTLGVHSVITGSIIEVSDGYRLRLKMLNVETRRIESSSSVPVNHRDNQINFYLDHIRKAERQEKREEQKIKSQETWEAIGGFFGDIGDFLFNRIAIGIIGGLAITGVGLGIFIPMAVTAADYPGQEGGRTVGGIIGSVFSPVAALAFFGILCGGVW